MVLAQGIRVDESDIQAIKEWSIPSSVYQALSFCGLASFYKTFMKNFSSIKAPMTEVLKAKKFKWNDRA